jgi:acetylornithine deacetylase/succinyl-diaminopimelate desuccinylase-like protein
MDVVPTDPAQWQHDPFGAEIANGNIWGRGTVDMKGPGVVQLMAFLSLKRQRVPLDRDVILMAVPDEVSALI